MRRERILEQLASARAQFEQFGVRHVWLFGSLARDEARPGSDVDVLVEFEGTATYDRYVGFKFFLEDLLNERVDLVMRSAVRPRMMPFVEQDAVLVA